MNKSGYQYRGKTKPETRWLPLTIRLHVVKYERHNLEVFQTYPINSDNAKKFIFFQITIVTCLFMPASPSSLVQLSDF